MKSKSIFRQEGSKRPVQKCSYSALLKKDAKAATKILMNMSTNCRFIICWVPEAEFWISKKKFVCKCLFCTNNWTKAKDIQFSVMPGTTKGTGWCSLKKWHNKRCFGRRQLWTSGRGVSQCPPIISNSKEPRTSSPQLQADHYCGLELPNSICQVEIS